MKQDAACATGAAGSSGGVATPAWGGRADDGSAQVPPRPGWWARYRKWALAAFAILVLAMLASHAHKIDWAGAWQALKSYPAMRLAAVFALAVTSHAIYGCFDLIGRRHTGHPLAAWRSWMIAVTSYAFNLNLGSLVGGVALRARLYARAGLDEATVAQVVGISLATNWLGYGVLAGGLFAAGVISPPAQTQLSATTFRAIGVGMLLLALVYVLACHRVRGRTWHVRGRPVHLPSPQLALLQLALSAANWALMGCAMYLLLRQEVPYGAALGTLMAAAIVGVITPIPAGLGVLEAVYLALLAGEVRQGALLGAVLAYRALYYLVPMASGLMMYLFLERYASRHALPEGTTADAPAQP